MSCLTDDTFARLGLSGMDALCGGAPIPGGRVSLGAEPSAVLPTSPHVSSETTAPLRLCLVLSSNEGVMKKRFTYAACVVGATIGVQLLQAGSALADDPTGGGGPGQMVQTPADAARSAAKMAAAEAYLGEAQQSAATSSASGLDSATGSLMSWSTWQAMVPSTERGPPVMPA